MCSCLCVKTCMKKANLFPPAFLHLCVYSKYGGYGKPDALDMVRNPLPIVDLRELQVKAKKTIPLHFYRADVARVPCSASFRDNDNNCENRVSNFSTSFSTKSNLNESMEQPFLRPPM